MATLELTNDQLRLVQRALDFYSRVGIGQMWAIKEHPTYEKHLYEKLRPKKELEVGDRTERGEIVEIGEGYIKTKGYWNAKEEVREWKDVDNIKLSIDYDKYHKTRDQAEKILNKGRNLLLQEELPDNGSWGIFNPNVDESCRVAFDIVQVIRHEFWKQNPDRSDITVDSSVNIWTDDGHKVHCKIDELMNEVT